MSNVSSLSSCAKWLEDVMSSNQGPSKPLIFLVGCKKELLCESAFKFVEKEGIKVANELNAEFWTVSSSTGENVPEFFTRVSTLTFQEMIHREISANQSNSLSNKLPVNYSTKFIKLRRDKSCKRFFSFSCSRLWGSTLWDSTLWESRLWRSRLKLRLNNPIRSHQLRA